MSADPAALQAAGGVGDGHALLRLGVHGRVGGADSARERGRAEPHPGGTLPAVLLPGNPTYPSLLTLPCSCPHISPH